MTSPPTGTVTFLFTDIEGSTEGWERDREAFATALARHNAILRGSIEAHRGHVFKTVGDAFCASFADAGDALAAAIEAQRALHAERFQLGDGDAALRVRMGLHTGLVSYENEDYHGRPVNRVARVMSAGHGGQVLLSLATQQLLRDALPKGAELIDLGHHRLKDLEHTEQLFRAEAPGLPNVGTAPRTDGRLADPAGRAVDAPLEDAPCPYRGLHAFREQDAPFFFGREVFTERLVDALATKPMVGVIGPSGSGKSSVVFAGLLPALRAGSNADRAANGDRSPGPIPSSHSTPWTVLRLRPGAEPFAAIAGALVPLLEPDLSRTARLVETARLTEALREGSLSVRAVVDDIRRAGDEHQRLLFVADQFEELYTLCPDTRTQRAFQDLLFEAVHDADRSAGDVKLALTLRADFMGHALAYRPFADAVQDHNVVLGPMNRDELARVVEHPAQLQHRAFEAGLVDRIVDDVGEEAGALPLLEFALTKLWEGQRAGWLTHEAYEAIGRVEGAVSRHADAVFGRLDEADQGRARKVIVQMVRPGEGTEDTRRVARREELGEDGWELARRLADARLLVTDRDEAGQETAEVVHEALLRTWGRLKEWMAEDRRFRTWQERLRFAIRQWHEAGRDESALLRGVPLAEAAQWADERGAELTGEEADFVAASQARARAREAERERQRRRTRRLQGAVAVVSVLGLLVASALALSERQSRRRSDALALVAKSQELLAEDQGDQALAVALEALVVDPGLAEAEVAVSEAAYQPGSTRELDLGGAVFGMASGPQGKRLIIGTAGGEVVVIDTERWSVERRLLGHTHDVQALAVHPDGHMAVTGGRDGDFIAWELTTGDTIWRQSLGNAYDATFSPDGKRVLFGGWWGLNGRLWLLDANDGRLIREFEHKDAVHSVAMDSGGRLALGAEGNPVGDGITVWDTTDGSVVAQLSEDPVSAVAITPDSRLVVGAIRNFDAGYGAANQREIVVWDLASGAEITRMEGHPATVRSLKTIDEGQVVMSASYDQSIRFWNLKTGAMIESLKGHSDGVRDVVQGDGRQLYSVDDVGVLRAWRRDSPAQSWSAQPAPGEALTGVALAPDGSLAATTDSNGDAWLVDLATGSPRAQFRTADSRACSVAFASDSQHVAVGTSNGVELWTLDPPDRRWRASPPTARSSTGCTAVAIGRDGRNVLSTGYRDHHFHAWHAETGSLVGAMSIGGATTRLGSDAATRWIVAPIESSPRDPAFWTGLWSVEHGERVNLLQGHEGLVLEAAIGEDARLVATAGVDNTVIVWDHATGREIQRIALEDSARSLSFGADERLLAIGLQTGTVLLWSVERDALLRRYPSSGAPVSGLAFTEAGRALVSIDGDTIRRWPVHGNVQELKDWIAGARLVTPISCRDRTALALPSPCARDDASALEGADRPSLLSTGRVRAELERDEQVESTGGVRDELVSYWFENAPDLAVEQFDLNSIARKLEGHGDAINDLSFSRGGDYLVTASGQFLPEAQLDGGVRIWDVTRGEQVRHFPTGYRMASAAISPDLRWTVGLSKAGFLYVWHTESQRLERRVQTGGGFWSKVRFVGGGPHVALGSDAAHTIQVVDVSSGEMTAKLEGHSRFIQDLSLEPSGSLLASAGQDGGVFLWNLQQESPVQRFSFSGAPPDPRADAVALLPDGSGIIAGGLAPPTLWSTDSGDALRTFNGHAGAVRALAVSPGGRFLLSSGDDRTVRLWDVATGVEQRRYVGHRFPTNEGLAFSPEGRLAASAGFGGTIFLWELGAFEDGPPRLDRPQPAAATISPRPLLINESSAQPRQAIRGPNEGRMEPGKPERWRMESDTDTVWDLHVEVLSAISDPLMVGTSQSIEDLELLVVDEAGTVVARDTNVDEDAGSVARVWNLPPPRSGSYDVVISTRSGVRAQDYRLWVTGTRLVRPVATLGDVRSYFDEPTAALRFSLDVSPDGLQLATGSGMTSPYVGEGDPPLVEVWDVERGTVDATLHAEDAHRGYVFDVAFGSDGRHVASASTDRLITLWDIASGAISARIEGHPGPIEDMRLSPAGDAVYSASARGEVLRWSLPEGALDRTYGAHRDRVVMLGLDAQGTRLLSASQDGSAMVWDVETGERLIHVDHGAALSSGAISPDGRSIGTGDRQGGLALWDADSGHLRWRLPTAHRGIVEGLRFSADGRRLASAGYDGTARVWSIESGEEQARLIGHETWVYDAAFGPDGQQVFTVGVDDTVRIFDLGDPAP